MNIVKSEVSNLIYGETAAPTVPIVLTHPKLNDETSVGNSSDTKTKNTPHTELIKNLKIAMRIISMIV